MTFSKPLERNAAAAVCAGQVTLVALLLLLRSGSLFLTGKLFSHHSSCMLNLETCTT